MSKLVIPSDPWHQQQGESDLKYRAFLLWLKSGDHSAQRSITTVYNQLGEYCASEQLSTPTEFTLAGWRKENDWVKRGNAYDVWVTEQSQFQLANDIRVVYNAALSRLLSIIQEGSDKDAVGAIQALNATVKTLSSHQHATPRKGEINLLQEPEIVVIETSKEAKDEIRGNSD